VTGVDNDVATIEMARVTVEGVGFEAEDAAAYLRRVPHDAFDVVVCFEGLEHLADPEPVLADLVERAQAGTRVLASVPNSKGLSEENPYHLTAFGWEEAQAVFARFPAAVTATQHVAESSLVVLAGDGAPGRLSTQLLQSQRTEPEHASHFLLFANCPEAELRSTVRLHLVAAPLHNRYLTGLQRANRELWRTNQRLARSLLGKTGAGAAKRVSRLEDEVGKRRRSSSGPSTAPPNSSRAAMLSTRCGWRRHADRAKRRMAGLPPLPSPTSRCA
jgi:SAM-dependent methyltransferase